MAMGRSAAAYDALRTPGNRTTEKGRLAERQGAETGRARESTYTETIVTVLNDAKTAGNGLNTALKK
jgi:hypothetical protein